MKLIVPVLFATCCWGQIGGPQIGHVRDRGNVLRPVYGIGGAFVLGDPVAEGVTSTAFSGRAGFAVTGSELLIFEGGNIVDRQAVREDAVSFGFRDDGRPHWVRFASGACLVRTGGRLHEAECPAETPQVLADGDEVILVRTGVRLRLAEPIEGIEQMGAGWMAVRTVSDLYAIRTEPDREAVYRLPEAAR